MKKTIKEWLNELPEPYRSQAIENAENTESGCLDGVETSIFGALMGGFVWLESKEGSDYWYEFSKTLNK